MTDFNNNNGKKGPRGNSNSIYWIYAAILGLFVIAYITINQNQGRKIIDINEFERLVTDEHVSRVRIVNNSRIDVYLNEDGKTAVRDAGKELPPSGPHYYFNKGGGDFVSEQVFTLTKAYNEEQPPENKIKLEFDEETDYTYFINILIPIALLVALWFFFMRRVGASGPGGQIFNIGKSRASLYDKENKVNVTFNDVAGLDEAKEEVQEVVEFLKNPQKFTRLGGHIPKGVLLVGPPGTGKTLLAKAVAGEAKVPFFSLSGSDFVEMFVGVGAARVRDLFKQAKEKAPCIIFIDEIDAVGRSRGRINVTGGNDERENTLNQLLVEMDGFGSDTGVIIMAATNRPDVLDPALLRAGRFDRQIAVDRPDIKGREAIFRVHLKKLTVADEVGVHKLAAQTPGFVGADIMNVCNEAALIAARKNKKAVGMDDFQDAIDRVIGGLEKKSKIISPEEKKIVAYHEAGHAITGWFLEHADPLVKVSIVPRGIAALGYAQYMPKEQYLYTENQLMDTICMTLGGRAAEELIFGEVSTGAQNDLERITKTAYSMVTIYGMNPKIGQVSFRDESEYNFNKMYSEATAQIIDEEVKKILDFAYERTLNLLKERKGELEKVAQQLLEKEVLFKEDLNELIGKRPFKEHSYLDAAEEESNGHDNGSSSSPSSSNGHSESEGNEGATSPEVKNIEIEDNN
ncbi:MAG: ATP-dependent zinc metalloprotease FtsH [Bacteroidota bacterium]